MANSTNTAVTTKVITGVVRLSYVHLLEPYANEDGGKEKYSTAILIPKEDHKTISAIKKAIESAKDLGRDKLKGAKNVSDTLRDGDEEKDTTESPEYANHFFMNVSSATKPGIIDLNKRKVEDPEVVYSGVYARVSINFFAYNTNGNKGISAGLNNVQIVKDGDYLGGRASAESDFDDDFELDEDDLDDLM